MLVAPFIDRFDRRKVLLFVYAGFVVGTLNCALADSTATLMTARILSGAFGGVSAATVLAIVSDVVPAQRHAAGIGIIMTAFSAAAALGVPFGLQLAQRFDWEAPFFMLATTAALMWVVAFFGVPPVRAHLEHNNGRRTKAFLESLRDANAGRVRVLAVLVVVASFVTLGIANSGPLPVAGTLALTGSFFVFASGRFMPGQTIVTLAVPPSRRGAFMTLSGCARDLASPERGHRAVQPWAPQSGQSARVDDCLRAAGVVRPLA